MRPLTVIHRCDTAPAMRPSLPLSLLLSLLAAAPGPAAADDDAPRLALHGQVQPAGRLHEVLLVEEVDLEAAGLQVLDQFFKGGVGVLEGFQRPAAHAPEQFPESRLAGEV